MKPKKYGLGGSETNPKAPVAKVKKTKLKKIVKKVKKKDPFRADTTESLDKEFSKSVAKANKKKDGGFPDLTGDNKVTQADILKGRGVPGFSRGGGMAIQGTGFKGIR